MILIAAISRLMPYLPNFRSAATRSAAMLADTASTNPQRIEMKIAPGNFDAGHCPLCGNLNHCQLCTVAAYKGSCWCAKVEIPDALLAQVPLEFKNKSCICRHCVMEFHRKRHADAEQKILPLREIGKNCLRTISAIAIKPSSFSDSPEAR